MVQTVTSQVAVTSIAGVDHRIDYSQQVLTITIWRISIASQPRD